MSSSSTVLKSRAYAETHGRGARIHGQMLKATGKEHEFTGKMPKVTGKEHEFTVKMQKATGKELESRANAETYGNVGIHPIVIFHKISCKRVGSISIVIAKLRL
ncbi:hypothetical protein CEY16_07325 [Halalkalibacillus sediminis]|uniref:Uncharacterized protein n=1 Tax=Halalkalibacillus sediminis TaxID=2018042 RepID=A0A2I0QTV7_9BACI|nr:hypothetical protein CEY16_07325 [Halalkalibacillus sediminis]